MTALRLRGISAGYGRTAVLRGVDLVVPAGKVVALLGPNGAGKTTLLKVAGGLLRPRAGEVWLKGRRVEQRREHHRARDGLCLIPEGHGIFRQLSVADNLAMFSGGRGVAPAIERATATFPILAERLRQEAGRLSGGQQQMLALCRALVTNADVILADELSLGLAPVVVDEIFAAVAELRAEGRSLLLVEQYVERALALADYVYILQKGRVAFVGEPEQCHTEGVFDRYVGAASGATTRTDRSLPVR
ncbi:MAG: ABC transporter ATP-binding protein [Actinomycetota bacterium]